VDPSSHLFFSALSILAQLPWLVRISGFEVSRLRRKGQVDGYINHSLSVKILTHQEVRDLIRCHPLPLLPALTGKRMPEFLIKFVGEDLTTRVWRGDSLLWTKTGSSRLLDEALYGFSSHRPLAPGQKFSQSGSSEFFKLRVFQSWALQDPRRLVHEAGQLL
jgi:hypothetical protein